MGSSDVQIAVLPESTLPLESFATACAADEWPGARLAESSVTATDAVAGAAGGGLVVVGGFTGCTDGGSGSTGEPGGASGVTRTDVLSAAPSIVRMISVVPTLFARTSPDESTLATSALRETQLIVVP